MYRLPLAYPLMQSLRKGREEYLGSSGARIADPTCVIGLPKAKGALKVTWALDEPLP